MSEPFIAEKSIMGALDRAAQDKEFAVKLFKNPREFQREYKLTDREVEAIQRSISPAVQKALDIDYE
jgi:hypothetical protein